MGFFGKSKFEKLQGVYRVQGLREVSILNGKPQPAATFFKGSISNISLSPGRYFSLRILDDESHANNQSHFEQIAERLSPLFNANGIMPYFIWQKERGEFHLCLEEASDPALLIKAFELLGNFTQDRKKQTDKKLSPETQEQIRKDNRVTRWQLRVQSAYQQVWIEQFILPAVKEDLAKITSDLRGTNKTREQANYQELLDAATQKFKWYSTLTFSEAWEEPTGLLTSPPFLLSQPTATYCALGTAEGEGTAPRGFAHEHYLSWRGFAHVGTLQTAKNEFNDKRTARALSQFFLGDNQKGVTKEGFFACRLRLQQSMQSAWRAIKRGEELPPEFVKSVQQNRKIEKFAPYSDNTREVIEQEHALELTLFENAKQGYSELQRLYGFVKFYQSEQNKTGILFPEWVEGVLGNRKLKDETLRPFSCLGEDRGGVERKVRSSSVPKYPSDVDNFSGNEGDLRSFRFKALSPEQQAFIDATRAKLLQYAASLAEHHRKKVDEKSLEASLETHDLLSILEVATPKLTAHEPLFIAKHEVLLARFNAYFNLLRTLRKDVRLGKLNWQSCIDEVKATHEAVELGREVDEQAEKLSLIIDEFYFLALSILRVRVKASDDPDALQTLSLLEQNKGRWDFRTQKTRQIWEPTFRAFHDLKTKMHDLCPVDHLVTLKRKQPVVQEGENAVIEIDVKAKFPPTPVRGHPEVPDLQSFVTDIHQQNGSDRSEAYKQQARIESYNEFFAAGATLLRTSESYQQTHPGEKCIPHQVEISDLYQLPQRSDGKPDPDAEEDLKAPKTADVKLISLAETERSLLRVYDRLRALVLQVEGHFQGQAGDKAEIIHAIASIYHDEQRRLNETAQANIQTYSEMLHHIRFNNYREAQQLEQNLATVPEKIFRVTGQVLLVTALTVSVLLGLTGIALLGWWALGGTYAGFVQVLPALPVPTPEAFPPFLAEAFGIFKARFIIWACLLGGIPAILYMNRSTTSDDQTPPEFVVERFEGSRSNPLSTIALSQYQARVDLMNTQIVRLQRTTASPETRDAAESLAGSFRLPSPQLPSSGRATPVPEGSAKEEQDGSAISSGEEEAMESEHEEEETPGQAPPKPVTAQARSGELQEVVVRPRALEAATTGRPVLAAFSASSSESGEESTAPLMGRRSKKGTRDPGSSSEGGQASAAPLIARRG